MWWREFTSSSKLGKIFLRFIPSENLPSTVARPFIKATFSSRVFDAKFDRSKKFSVEIASEEKYE